MQRTDQIFRVLTRTCFTSIGLMLAGVAALHANAAPVTETTLKTPTVTLSLSASSVTTLQTVKIAVTVSGGSGNPTPTGSIKLSSGSYLSAQVALTAGKAALQVVASNLAAESGKLTVTYTPASASVYSAASVAGHVTLTRAAPSVAVSVAPASATQAQLLTAKVGVTVPVGGLAPQGSVTLISGTYSSGAVALSAGAAQIQLPATLLAVAKDTLTATYTPNTAAAEAYLKATGAAKVTVTAVSPRLAPKLTFTLPTKPVLSTQAVLASVALTGPSGDLIPTGSVALSLGGANLGAAYLTKGAVTITLAAGKLPNGADALTAAYTPDTESARVYAPASARASVTVDPASLVSVNQKSTGPEVTDQLLGMNMASWFDPTNPFVVPAFQKAGIKAIRWPGGSWSDIYHWNGNFTCASSTGEPPFTPTGWADPGAEYTKVIEALEIPAGLDVALTANYGTDAACTGPGNPTEASGWVKAWQAAGGKVSHVTVGNEVYGSWETDLHTKPNDPATYATAAHSYYSDIKAVNKEVLVGVAVDADNSEGGWDQTVLANAKGAYDFVEFHFYPQAPDHESDQYIVHQGALDLTSNIDTLKTELKTAGLPETPIYVGEIGSVYTNPGKQSWSITQGLYAGQALGEMMNAGISRLTWWIGFGNCNGTAGNMSASLYGWQDFGAYNVFSDGSALDPDCPGANPAGTMSPTAQAFNLFQNVAVTGEKVLTPAVTGDTTDVRAYAATHSGGTALVLFNLNETASQVVQVELSAQTESTGVTVITYSKAIYDKTKTGVWDPPTTTTLGAQKLPLLLTLAPWSMNVVLLK